MNDERRGQHGTTGAVVFVVALSGAGAILLLLSIPLGWAIVATLGIAAGGRRMVRDIRGGRAM